MVAGTFGRRDDLTPRRLGAMTFRRLATWDIWALGHMGAMIFGCGDI